MTTTPVDVATTTSTPGLPPVLPPALFPSPTNRIVQQMLTGALVVVALTPLTSGAAVGLGAVGVMSAWTWVMTLWSVVAAVLVCLRHQYGGTTRTIVYLSALFGAGGSLVFESLISGVQVAAHLAAVIVVAVGPDRFGRVGRAGRRWASIARVRAALWMSRTAQTMGWS